jgi:hypothetical protein
MSVTLLGFRSGLREEKRRRGMNIAPIMTRKPQQPNPHFIVFGYFWLSLCFAFALASALAEYSFI